MSDGFEDAADSVSGSHSSSQQGMAQAVYEDREYPNCPEGRYIAICVASDLKESRSEFDAPGTLKINLRWEILSDARTGQPITYVDPKDPEKKQRRYQVFGKPLGIAFGDRANLPKLMKELTGIPPVVERKREMRQFAGIMAPKEVTVVNFDHKMLLHMQAEVKVAHKPYTSPTTGIEKIGVSIEALDCDMKMKRANYDLVPPGPEKKPFPGQSQMQAQPAPAVPPAPVAPVQPAPPIAAIGVHIQGPVAPAGQQPVMAQAPVQPPHVQQVKDMHQQQVDSQAQKYNDIPDSWKA